MGGGQCRRKISVVCRQTQRQGVINKTTILDLNNRFVLFINMFVVIIVVISVMIMVMLAVVVI